MMKLYRWWQLLLYYTWFIVLWGAFVRASGSGDGCGKNWPTCHGELFPKDDATIQTLIEYIHRATSGLYGIFVFALVLITIFYVRKGLKTSFLRQNNTYTKINQHSFLAYLFPFLVLFLTIFEALIGAKLVLSGLVGSNDSWDRALIMIVHLLNTFLLVASIVGATYLVTPPEHGAGKPTIRKSLYSLCTLCLVLVAGLGALTALGDTLYPAESLSHGMNQDFAATTPWILRLRILHPLLAVLTVFLITITGQNHTKSKGVLFYLFLSYVTLGIGVVNLLLLAPIYMQLIHLLIAQALWATHCQLGFKLFIPERKELI